MGFDNREAHAHAVGLRRVEWFKETRQSFRAQPGAGVSHPEAHRVRFRLAGSGPRAKKTEGGRSQYAGASQFAVLNCPQYDRPVHMYLTPAIDGKQYAVVLNDGVAGNTKKGERPTDSTLLLIDVVEGIDDARSREVRTLPS
jgi:hypothetical protein